MITDVEGVCSHILGALPRGSNSIAVAISGQHGAGKTEFGKNVAFSLAGRPGVSALVIQVDAYLRLDRQEREAILSSVESGARPVQDSEQAYAVDSGLLAEHVSRIQRREPIQRVLMYSRQTGRRTQPFDYQPSTASRQIVLVEGIWVLGDGMRALCGLVYLLVAPKAVRRARVQSRARSAATPYSESDVRFENLDAWTTRYIQSRGDSDDIIIDNSDFSAPQVVCGWPTFEGG